MQKDDIISRQDAIKALWNLDIELRPSAIDAILNMLNSLPSAQPEILACGEGELNVPYKNDRDLISRQALMKEFSNFVRASNNSDFAQTPTWNDAVSLVGSMPSAQPELEKINEAHNEGYDVGYWAGRRDYEKKWIPVTERLPEEGQRVLVTHLGGLNPERQVIEHIYSGGGFILGWEMDMDVDSPTFGQRYMGDVIAWMPLPEPWKGEKHE